MFAYLHTYCKRRKRAVWSAAAELCKREWTESAKTTISCPHVPCFWINLSGSCFILGLPSMGLHGFYELLLNINFTCPSHSLLIQTNWFGERPTFDIFGAWSAIEQAEAEYLILTSPDLPVETKEDLKANLRPFAHFWNRFSISVSALHILWASQKSGTAAWFQASSGAASMEHLFPGKSCFLWCC